MVLLEGRKVRVRVWLISLLPGQLVPPLHCAVSAEPAGTVIELVHCVVLSQLASGGRLRLACPAPPVGVSCPGNPVTLARRPEQEAPLSQNRPQAANLVGTVPTA